MISEANILPIEYCQERIMNSLCAPDSAENVKHYVL